MRQMRWMVAALTSVLCCVAGTASAGPIQVNSTCPFKQGGGVMYAAPYAPDAVPLEAAVEAAPQTLELFVTPPVAGTVYYPGAEQRRDPRRLLREDWMQTDWSQLNLNVNAYNNSGAGTGDEVGTNGQDDGLGMSSSLGALGIGVGDADSFLNGGRAGRSNGTETAQGLSRGAATRTPEPASLVLWGLVSGIGLWYGRRQLRSK